ncbi:MAG: hypothetical protein P8Y97_21280 [Candidatus Lokiarchaeota archaeon]
MSESIHKANRDILLKENRKSNETILEMLLYITELLERILEKITQK